MTVRPLTRSPLTAASRKLALLMSKPPVDTVAATASDALSQRACRKRTADRLPAIVSCQFEADDRYVMQRLGAYIGFGRGPSPWTT